MSTFRTACVLGIVAVYCVSMFPLLVAGDISWAKPAVAVGAIIQVCASYIEAPLKSVAFVGAASSALVIISPVSSYFACCAAYGIFYASFLNRVEFPEKVLKAEFVGELLFLPGASLCLIYFKSLELLIILVGVVWWLLSPDWIPEKPDPSKGSNPLFLAGWMCCSAVMSALLLSGVFIVSEVYEPSQRARVVCIGLLLIMIGGCSAAVAFDTRSWLDVMFAGMTTSILLCAGILVFDMNDLTLGVMAYALGISMSATLVAVRKAYAGSYSTLLAMQKVAEVFPAIIIAVSGERVAMYTHIGVSIVSILIFGVVHRRERSNLQRQMRMHMHQETI